MHTRALTLRKEKKCQVKNTKQKKKKRVYKNYNQTYSST